MTRPRLARLQRIAEDIGRAARRRRRGPQRAHEPDQRTSDELARRLDATRDRLRRDIPPRAD
jgi:hypothetical protein